MLECILHIYVLNIILLHMSIPRYMVQLTANAMSTCVASAGRVRDPHNCLERIKLTCE